MFVHGNNLEQKENHQTKYRDDESRRYLSEIRAGKLEHKYLLDKVEKEMNELRELADKSPLPKANNSKAIEKLYREVCEIVWN